MRLLSVLMVVLLTAALHGAALEGRNVAGPDTAPVFAEHDPFTASVTVRNPHDRAVRVDRLDASCSCMHLDIASRFLLPHEATTLVITVANKDRSGPQRMGVSIYYTDPELEASDVEVWWKVRADVAVDAIAPLADSAARPAEIAWRDVYKYVDHERPDELARLRKRVRLESPDPGLEILGIDYAGPVWAFTPTRQADGSWLISAQAKDPAATLAAKTYDEQVVVRTNHPRKPTIALNFVAVIDPEAGRAVVDPMSIMGMPPGGP